MAGRRGKGEGSIRQRKDGLWEASITIGKTVNGNSKRRSEYGKTRKEVARKLSEMLAQQNKGMLLEPSRMTVTQSIERWIEGKTNVSENTRYKYQRETAPILTILGDFRLQDLRAHHVRDAYTALAKQELSVRAQKKAAGHLRAALREAVHDGIITRNFADGIKVSTPRVQEVAQAWVASEVKLFLNAAEDDPLFPFFYMIITLGLRRGEALGLPWDAVDLDAATVRIGQALVLSGKGSEAVLRDVKTPSSRRMLHVSQDVLELLKRHRARQDEQRSLMGSDWHDIGLVFTTALGTPINPRNALRSFKRLLKPLDVTPIRLHDRLVVGKKRLFCIPTLRWHCSRGFRSRLSANGWGMLGWTSHLTRIGTFTMLNDRLQR